MRRNLGFTLVELLIVIGILGILAAGSITLLNPANQFKKSRDSERKSELKQIQSALEIYRADEGVYPVSTDANVANCPAASATSLLDPGCTGSASYMQTVPKDPKFSTINSGNYYYCDDTTCGAPSGGYALFACIENTADTDSNIQATGPSGFVCNPAKYYKVINP